jgi:hypothetical protein
MQTSNAFNVWNRSRAPAQTVGDHLELNAYALEQALFLQRLSDLVGKRRQLEGCPSHDDWHQRLIDKALYSTYVDCLNLGVADEAREILHRGQGVHS